MSRYDDLMNFEFPEFVQSYTSRDTILYALGVGAGDVPTDPWEIQHVYEDGLRALPTMAVTLAYPGNWYRNLPLGIDDVQVLHASEHIHLHRTLPVAATVAARPRIIRIHDKGEGRGAFVVSERVVRDQSSGEPLVTVTQTAFCRADGGLGGPIVPAPSPHRVPESRPDVRSALATSLRSALIYRLSGDDNPLHIDSEFARQAGFPKPILHGLCTKGHIGRALLKAFCSDGRVSIQVMDCRFVGIVYPGDELTIDFWHDGETISFRAWVGDRKVVDNGMATLAEMAP